MPGIKKPPNLEIVRDEDACVRLRLLLDPAIAELRSFQADPVIVASCPHRFNDAGYDEDWRGIRVGDFHSERLDYFDRPPGHERRLAEGPDQGRRANRLIDHLEREGWRELYQRTYEREMSSLEVMALVVQEDLAFLVVNHTNGYEDAIYELPREGGLRHIGRPAETQDGRFDQRLDKNPPLIIRTIADDAAEREALTTWIEELMARAAQTPDKRGLQALRGNLSETERLHRLADTGRIAEEEYGTLLGRLSQIAAQDKAEQDRLREHAQGFAFSYFSTLPDPERTARVEEKQRLWARLNELELARPKQPAPWRMQDPDRATPLLILQWHIDYLLGTGRVSQTEHSTLHRRRRSCGAEFP